MGWDAGCVHRSKVLDPRCLMVRRLEDSRNGETKEVVLPRISSAGQDTRGRLEVHVELRVCPRLVQRLGARGTGCRDLIKELAGPQITRARLPSDFPFLEEQGVNRIKFGGERGRGDSILAALRKIAVLRGAIPAIAGICLSEVPH